MDKEGLDGSFKNPEFHPFFKNGDFVHVFEGTGRAS
jgi:hypothetical protein